MLQVQFLSKLFSAAIAPGGISLQQYVNVFFIIRMME
jgi:hypothetical protein